MNVTETSRLYKRETNIENDKMNTGANRTIIKDEVKIDSVINKLDHQNKVKVKKNRLHKYRNI